MATCSICGGESFVPGPKGRLYAGRPVMCAGCNSLERHRVIRRVWNALPRDYLGGLDVLQFAEDVSFDKTAAKSFELSVYGAKNSLDIQSIKRPDGKYDIVVANHVLEHVPDATKAVSEMLRVTRDSGFIQLSVPGTSRNPYTKDWGYPDPAKHQHYRHYGADFPYVIGKPILENYCVMASVLDSVTRKHEWVTFVSRSRATAAFLGEKLIAGKIVAMFHGRSPVAETAEKRQAARG